MFPRFGLWLVALIALAHSISGASVADYGGARLIASDSTESSPAGTAQPVVFFAQFMNASSGASISGSCNLSVSRVNLSNLIMTFNGSGDSRFNLSVSSLFNGDTQYNITCASQSLGPVTAFDTAFVRPASNLTIQAPSSSDAPGQAHFNVTFVNSSNGAVISGASCVMYFQSDAGQPLAPLMGYNATSNRYEHRRAFYTGGNFTYNASCTAPGFEPGFASGSIIIRQYLPNATNFNDHYTTNFSVYSSLDSIDLTLSNRYGQIHWLSNVNATLRDFDSFVYLGNNFISVNASGLGSGYNSSVEVILRSAYSSDVIVASGTYFQASQVRSAGIPCDLLTKPVCSNVAVAGSIVSFRASFPLSFALGADANLSVRTNGPIAQYSRIIVFANYTNSSSGQPIAVAAPYFAQCSMTFSPLAGDPQNGVMSYDSAGLHSFSRDVNLSGSFDYNVTCESDTFTYRQASGSFISVAVASPPSEIASAVAITPSLSPALASPPSPLSQQDVPLGPVPDPLGSSVSSRTLIATSGGLTTSLNVGDEFDVSINGVTIIASVESVDDGVAKARLGSERGSVSQGQELLMDVDKDGAHDVSMKLLGVSRDSVKVMIRKLRGLDDDAASVEPDSGSSGNDDFSSSRFSGKSKPQPIEEPVDNDNDDDGLSWWWFLLIFVFLLLAGQWYFKYNQRMRRGFV